VCDAATLNVGGALDEDFTSECAICRIDLFGDNASEQIVHVSVHCDGIDWLPGWIWDFCDEGDVGVALHGVDNPFLVLGDKPCDWVG